MISAPSEAGRLLESMNLHGHVIIARSPRFTLRGVHPLGLDGFVTTRIRHYSIRNGGFTALRILWHWHF